MAMAMGSSRVIEVSDDDFILGLQLTAEK